MAEKLKFYDLKAKKSFITDKWKKTIKGKRTFAVAKAPSGCAAWRILGVKKSKK